MIDNFEETKKQLSELSQVLNKFNSEAVQLRILDQIFSSYPGNVQNEEFENMKSQPTKPAKGARAKRPTNAKKASSSNSDRSNSRKEGPKAVLAKLADEGYFNERRGMAEIQQYCKDALARNFKTGDLSPTLRRLVTDRTLTREKNSENGQYEYFTR